MSELTSSSRRRFLQALLAVGAAGSCIGNSGRLLAGSTTVVKKDEASSVHSQLKMGNEEILILIYPGFTAIDAIGPEYILSGMMGASVRLVAKTAKPLKSESGIEFVPHLTFADCSRKPTLFIVPGGVAGTIAAIEDPATLRFIREVGGASKIAGSVCTGSLLLGSAGLLQGYAATSHWQTLDLLRMVGAEPKNERVVFDRNRVTGAGVTAGLDFALELVKYFRGDFYAKGMQLLAQYDPQPPFPGGGNPMTADPSVVALLNEMHQPLTDKFSTAIKKGLR
ncbi:MAG: DJ-1/PfpI family protein [Cyanobacteria bacterium]|jgi:putative intracellular protease/amidase|nr:DJ-1/PfpI family protein [Cyanobacteriota bacterium]